jgi:hypothetical protein
MFYLQVYFLWTPAFYVSRLRSTLLAAVISIYIKKNYYSYPPNQIIVRKIFKIIFVDFKKFVKYSILECVIYFEFLLSVHSILKDIIYKSLNLSTVS